MVFHLHNAFWLGPVLPTYTYKWLRWLKTWCRLLRWIATQRHKPNEWLCWDRQTPMVSMYHKVLYFFFAIFPYYTVSLFGELIAALLPSWHGRFQELVHCMLLPQTLKILWPAGEVTPINMSFAIDQLLKDSNQICSVSSRNVRLDFLIFSCLE